MVVNSIFYKLKTTIYLVKQTLLNHIFDIFKSLKRYFYPKGCYGRINTRGYNKMQIITFVKGLFDWF